jgi:hypothetical protein
MPKVVFSSTTSAVDWNTRLARGDAVTEVARLKTEDGGPMDIGGASPAAVPCGAWVGQFSPTLSNMLAISVQRG